MPCSDRRIFYGMNANLKTNCLKTSLHVHEPLKTGNTVWLLKTLIALHKAYENHYLGWFSSFICFLRMLSSGMAKSQQKIYSVCI